MKTKTFHQDLRWSSAIEKHQAELAAGAPKPAGDDAATALFDAIKGQDKTPAEWFDVGYSAGFCARGDIEQARRGTAPTTYEPPVVWDGSQER